MNKTVVVGVLLLALGVVAGVSLGWRGEGGRDEPTEERLDGRSVSTDGVRPDANATGGVADRHAGELQRRLEQLAGQLAAEAKERRRLDERMDQLASELSTLRGHGDTKDRSGTVAPERGGAAATAGPARPGDEAALTQMDRALVAAGISPAAAEAIKRRRDQLELSEIYLRDLATREGWQDTPRFAQEMAEIEGRRTPMRDEIGDEAYDRYLAALDQPNRVAVDDVLLDSPAAVAGLQAGDVVLRYGDTRIFAPNDLVAATRTGQAGEAVPLEILRGGQRIEIEVPRGPLGVRIAASRGDPSQG